MNAKTSKFRARTVNAVAERCWWKGPKKQKLDEHFNLTKEQINTLRATPQYQEVVESFMLGQRSAEQFEKWVEEYHNRYGDMDEPFGKWMGLAPTVVPDMCERVREAHSEIKAGRMTYPKRHLDPYNSKVDTSQAKIIGCRNHFEYVYLYYFPTDRRSSETYFPCNIGKTTKPEVTGRVAAQIGQQRREKARLALVIRIDDCDTLEREIHNELKRRGKWLDPNSDVNVVGREWFLTNRAEVMRIFRRLQGG